jgi:hypothetical protein
MPKYSSISAVPKAGTVVFEGCHATAEEEMFVKDNNCTSSVKIVNRKCSGMCRSFYDPATDTATCHCCRPKIFSRVNVNLECQDSSKNFIKEVKIVESCECQAMT